MILLDYSSTFPLVLIFIASFNHRTFHSSISKYNLICWDDSFKSPLHILIKTHFQRYFKQNIAILRHKKNTNKKLKHLLNLLTYSEKIFYQNLHEKSSIYKTYFLGFFLTLHEINLIYIKRSTIDLYDNSNSLKIILL